MSARPNPATGMDGVNVVLLSDGARVHLDDLATAAEGQRCLDDLDGAIDRIEAQLADPRSLDQRGLDTDWRRRAGLALKRKRRTRPRLQQRIAELHRAERRSAVPSSPGTEPRDAKRVAFINAAEQLLDHEVFTEIWARAAEMEPAAFGEGSA